MPKGVFVRKKRPLGELFWPKVDKNGPVLVPALGPCWIWTAARFTKGQPYGQFQFQGRPHVAHRIAWLLTYGYLPTKPLMHLCDNPPCVNPSHLREGSALENNQDMNRKGRNPISGKLAEKDVREIVAARWAGEKMSAIGDRYGVTSRTVQAICEGRIWGHLDLELPPIQRVYKLSRDDIEEIIRLRAEGVPVSRLATNFGVSEVSVYAVLKRTKA